MPLINSTNLSFPFSILGNFSLLLLPAHWGSEGTRGETREEGDKLFFCPAKGWRGRGEKGRRVLGHLRSLRAPLRGRKAREREEEEGRKGGDVGKGGE